MLDFTAFWATHYENQLGGELSILEASFMEVAIKAWDSPDETFEAFWSSNYEGRLGSPTIEASFREVARKAWEGSHVP